MFVRKSARMNPIRRRREPDPHRGVRAFVPKEGSRPRNAQLSPPARRLCRGPDSAILFGPAAKAASRGVAQLGRALASGARGRRFKSCHPDFARNIESAPGPLGLRGAFAFLTWRFGRVDRLASSRGASRLAASASARRIAADTGRLASLPAARRAALWPTVLHPSEPRRVDASAASFFGLRPSSDAASADPRRFAPRVQDRGLPLRGSSNPVTPTL
jgi:hypothetical protein